jgi:hypothetical protein
MASSSPIAASPVKKKKNLPFKRTVARKKSPDPFGDEPRPGKGNSGGRDDDDDDDGINMFRRSNEVFPLAIEEQQRRLRREGSRKKAAPIERESPEVQGPKRRRISDNFDSDDDDLTNSGSRHSSKRFGSLLEFSTTPLIGIVLLGNLLPGLPANTYTQKLFPQYPASRTLGRT